MSNLYQKLYENGKSDVYPYHMPGHKRKPLTEILRRVCDIDITEIDGFDNLHHAEGILRDVQMYAANVYGSEESFFLVNGSTAGVLSAFSVVARRGETVLIARNCHKSVYHGAFLNGINLEYLFPDVTEKVGFPCAITAKQVQKALEDNKTIKAVIIVSPTYEGCVSDIAKIAETVHAYGIPLIVDEAHGAHLGFHDMWPKSACVQGADLIIQSLHKTVPSPTQTALLHVNGTLIDRDRLRRYLAIFQTSSPSYVFLAAMAEAIAFMAEEGRAKMEQFFFLWKQMLKQLEGCNVLKIYPGDDIGKLVISVENSDISGQELYERLLSEYHLQMEMAGGSYVLAMFTLADEEEAYQRLSNALVQIDKSLQSTQNMFKVSMYNQAPKKFELWEAWDMPTELVEIERCCGRVAGEFINLYPPGTPLVVPGEVLNEEIVGIIKEYSRQNLPVHGVSCEGGRIWVKVTR